MFKGILWFRFTRSRFIGSEIIGSEIIESALIGSVSLPITTFGEFVFLKETIEKERVFSWGGDFANSK